MKHLLFLSLIPAFSYAKFSKPELLARFMYTNAWNVPDNVWCFSGEPVALRNRVYLNCRDEEAPLMASWSEKGFEVLAQASVGQLYSKPVSAFQKISWYEFSETAAVRVFTASPQVQRFDIRNLGPQGEENDSFLPLTRDTFFFKTKGERPALWIWKNGQAVPFLDPEAAYVFYPQVGPQGEIGVKTRSTHLDENAPDKLWLYQGSWKVVLEDRDSNPSSPWLGFRNQVIVEGNKILTIAKDSRGWALVLVDNGRTQVLAREGVDLKSFDYFSPKMRAGTIVVRGEDFDGKKVTYVKDDGPFRKLLSQDDIVDTDQGPGKVFYQSKDSIFYGAPGLDEKGNVYLQATLTHPENPKVLLGVGLIKFKKE